MTARCSEIAQVSRNCLAQFGVAAIRRIPQQVSSFLCENLRSEAFPYSNRKFIHCRNARDQRDACSCACCPEIKLISHASIWNRSHPLGDANWALDWVVGFRVARSQKCFGKQG